MSNLVSFWIRESTTVNTNEAVCPSLRALGKLPRSTTRISDWQRPAPSAPLLDARIIQCASSRGAAGASSNALFFHQNCNLQISGSFFRNRNAKMSAPLSKCTYTNVLALLQNPSSQHVCALKTLLYKHSVGGPNSGPPPNAYIATKNEQNMKIFIIFSFFVTI